MNQSKISVRYAKAFFEFGSEKKMLESIVIDVKLLIESLHSIPVFKEFIENPIVRPSDKKLFVSQLLTKKVSKETIDFLNVLITNKREAYLQDILRNFLGLYRAKSGVTQVTVTSAIELTKQQKGDVISHVEKEYKTKVDLIEKIDSAILGGYIIRIDDLQYDASIKTKLKQVKKELLAKSN